MRERMNYSKTLKSQLLNSCELVWGLWLQQWPVWHTFIPVYSVSSASFSLFNKIIFRKKKKKRKDNFLVHWVQECVPVKATGRPTVRLKYSTVLVATLGCGMSSTSDIWLLLNKDPSVWISEAGKTAQWLWIDFSGPTLKKNNTCNT